MNRYQRRATAAAMKAGGGIFHRIQTLSATAHSIVTDRMVNTFNNGLSSDHSEALMRVVGRLSFMAYGKETGRWALDLPCGGGKTQAVVSWLTAVHRLGLDKSAIIAASHIEGLIKIKHDLLTLGVPEEKIGLLHDKTFDPARAAEFEKTGDYSLLEHRFASMPATQDNDARQFLLVSHNRIRGAKQNGDKLALINTFKGHPRDLVIWDEVLIASQSWAVSTVGIASGLGYLRPIVDATDDQALAATLGYLDSCQHLITSEQHQQTSGTPPALVRLPVLSELEQDLFSARLGDRDATGSLRSLIKMNGCDLRVAPLGTAKDGKPSKAALVRYVLTVPRELTNIAVLDASHTVNKLVELDSTIKRDAWFDGRVIKSYENVNINFMVGPSGRNSVEADFGAKATDQRKLPREIVSIVQGIPEDEAVIIFTFKHRQGHKGAVNIPAVIRRDLKEAGVDLGAVTPMGRPRIVILTWGNHTSLSEYAYCSNVVFAGVLHRSDEDLTGAAVGQTDNLLVDLGGLVSLDDIKRGEIANVLYQALSRGSCRFTDQGKAKPMKAWLIHHDPGIRLVLEKVMPGAAWVDWQGSHGAGLERKTYATAVKIAEFLRGLDAGMSQISVSRLRSSAGLGEVPNRTFSNARQLLLNGGIENVGWQLSGRSFIRTDNPFLAA